MEYLFFGRKACRRRGLTGARGVIGALSLVASATASAFHICPEELHSTTRATARAAHARQTAMYLVHTGFGFNFSILARAFGRDPSTVRHACALIEIQRDKRRFDYLLARLEWAVRIYAKTLEEASSATASSEVLA
jgi:hypothetical protein